jgi:flagellar motor switch protein FliM
MAYEEKLSQEDIDALLNTPGSKDETTSGGEKVEGGLNPFDFRNQKRYVQERLPLLEQVCERFARLFRESMFRLLRRAPDVAGAGFELMRYGDYVKNLPIPASVNVVAVPPLKGHALLVFDVRLVYSLVDHYFGGSGRYQALIEGREFTRTERQVIELVLQRAFADLSASWAPVVPKLAPKLISSEINPTFAQIAGATDMVAVSRFQVEMADGGGGEMHIVLTMLALEPLRAIQKGLDVGVLGQTDKSWQGTLIDDLLDTRVEVRAELGSGTVTLRHLMEAKPGMLWPIHVPKEIKATVAGVPIFSGKYGVYQGKKGIQVTTIHSDSKDHRMTLELIQSMLEKHTPRQFEDLTLPGATDPTEQER